jgi:hypothetical protein
MHHNFISPYPINSDNLSHRLISQVKGQPTKFRSSKKNNIQIQVVEKYNYVNNFDSQLDT